LLVRRNRPPQMHHQIEGRMLKLPRMACRATLAALLLLAAVLVTHLPLRAAEPEQPASRLALEIQPKLVERALAELQPTAEPSGHLYFVGFAGYGPAAVFKREVVAVQELFNERFGTRGRSVALINHISTVHDVPLASAQNLERVLQYLGRLMHP